MLLLVLLLLSWLLLSSARVEALREEGAGAVRTVRLVSEPVVAAEVEESAVAGSDSAGPGPLLRTSRRRMRVTVFVWMEAGIEDEDEERMTTE